MRIEFNVIDDLKRVQLAEEPVELAIAITTTQYASLTKKIGELVPRSQASHTGLGGWARPPAVSSVAPFCLGGGSWVLGHRHSTGGC